MWAALASPGRDHEPARLAVVVAWGLWLLVAAGFVVAFMVDLLDGQQGVVLAVVDYWSAALPFLAFTTVGALILSRRPHNAIGWLCWAIGAVVGFGNVGTGAALRMAGDPVSHPVALVGLLGSAMFLVSLLGLLPLLVLVFPSGRLPSRRWRPALLVFAGGLVLYLGLYVLQPRPLGDGLPDNPLGVGWAERLMDRIGPLLFLLFGLFVVLVLGSLVLRFRRARGDERQQLKWLTYAAALLVVFPPMLGVMLERIDTWVPAAMAFALVVSTVPAAIGVAVLKYRLYDIDRVINRTLVYGLLTTLLVAVYAAGVFVLGHLLNSVSGDSALAVAASTLAVAALFQPARRRIQAVVDRRFNRRRYDAARTVEAFSRRLRDEVDLNALAAELVAVVDQTMQPTAVSLWLQPAAQVHPHRKASAD